MVRAAALGLAALAAAGCIEAGPPVLVDLCPSPTAEPADVAAMDGADLWQAVALIFRSDQSTDVAFERSFGADRAPEGPLLSLSGALPPSTPMRLMVVGYRMTGSGSDMVAIASSPPLEVVGGEQLCLCVAPPEAYGDDCSERSCRSDEGGSCQF